MRLSSLLLTALALPFLAAGQAHAQTVDGNLTFTAVFDLTSLPATQMVGLGANSAASGFQSDAAISFQTANGTSAQITFGAGSPIAGIYTGDTVGVAAPVQTAGGGTLANYVAAEPNGNVTISYTKPQTAFALDWGTVDSYNTLAFYNGSKLVGEITGSQVLSGATGYAGTNTAQVGVTLANGTQFTSVVAMSSQAAFEFGIIKSPAPAPLGLPGASRAGALAGLVLLWDVMRRKQA